jgi:hypothetical protein
MHHHPLLGGAVALLLAGTATFAALSVPSRSNLHHAGATAPGAAHLVVATGRSPVQRSGHNTDRLDASLAALARHAPLARAGHTLADLHDMNPAARFARSAASGVPLVLVDAATSGNPAQLRAALEGLGLERASVYANDVGGWLPVSRILDAAAVPRLATIHATLRRARGSVATQGDYAQRSSIIRTSFPSLTGSGVTVGVLSDSFDCYQVYADAGSSVVPVGGYSGYAYNGFTATAADDEASGALPSSVRVLAEPYTGNGTPTATGQCLDYGAPDQAPFSDEGRAMLQVVHAVAPGASLAFYTGDNSEAGFANGIRALANAGAKVIADDLGYFDEPFYQDGIIAQAIDTVAAGGVAYFSAAGNNADTAWESASPSFRTLSSGPTNAGEYLLNFDTSGATTATALPITVAPLQPGEFLGIIIEWDQPYVTGAAGSGGATSRIDVCVTGTTGVYPIVQDYAGDNVTCTGPNGLGSDPVQVLILGNPASATGNTPLTTLNLIVGLADGTPAPGRVIVAVDTDGQTSPPPLTSYATHSPTLQGHPGAAGAAAVGASFFFQTPLCGSTPAVIEAYSSLGGTPILFDSTGTRISPVPPPRQKPDFVGPDGINNTFLGFTLTQGSFNGVPIGAGGQLATSTPQCQNDASYPNFFGTSAATPHAAGVAALMLQANRAATPAQIYAALQQAAAPMTAYGATPNFQAGYGFIQADYSLGLLPPALTLANASIAAGQSTTLTWSSFGTTSCSASGSWSGAQASAGTVTVSPASAGSYTYSLACSDPAGTSATTAATLTVTAGTGSSGGSSSSGGSTSSSSSSGSSSSGSSSSGTTTGSGGGGGGGGGALGWPTLGFLALLGLGLRRRSLAG